MPTIGLHWFRNDLRISDNEGFAGTCNNADSVLALYVFEEAIWQPKNEMQYSIGSHRLAFLCESLKSLRQELEALNIQLLCVRGNPENVLGELIETNNIQYISSEFHPGTYEKQAWQSIQATFPNKIFTQHYSNYLYKPDELPFLISDMPNVFSPFRRKVEKYTIIKAPYSATVSKKLAYLCNLPAKPSNFEFVNIDEHCDSDVTEIQAYLGGTIEAERRINDYFYATNGIASYKETRNGLDGWHFSSRLSAYLSLGCISPKQVVAAIQLYENTVTKNDSTYWLVFELLWREFFHWQLHKHEDKFFIKHGQRNNESEIPSNCLHNESLFLSWCNGSTDFPIVNACMKQLRSTGFMSNRGRQLVASCFIHELGLDWRYGAAYFEQHLVDYDVASNYGNWQYLAGVGSDPRGIRQFNLSKQTEIYDPKHTFINAWT